MNLIRSVIATALFECRRSLSLQRILVGAVLAGFPPAMVTVIRFSGSPIPISNLLIISLVGIVAVLAQLLWATPNVYSELEGKSWIFLASRPRGRIALFLGKYLSAVCFSFAVCLIAITLCLAARTYLPPQSMVNPSLELAAMSGTALIGCLAYSAVFSTIGTIFQKRAMVFGAAYIILSEAILANVPAIINRFTARFHLQAVAADWIGWFHPIPQEDYNLLFGDFSTGFHLVWLFIATVGMLMIGSVIITTRQYITADET